MELASIVKKYLEKTGGFDRPMHLSELGLSQADTEKILSALDEDYQISRYMLFSRERDEALDSFPSASRVYLINGFECSHMTFRPGIQKLM